MHCVCVWGRLQICNLGSCYRTNAVPTAATVAANVFLARFLGLHPDGSLNNFDISKSVVRRF